MASPLSTNGLYQCRAWTLQAEQAAVNTVYYLVLSQAGTPTTDADLAINFEALVAPQYKALISTDAQFRGVQVTLTNPAPGVPVPATQFSNLLVGAGSASPPDCPRQVSGIIQWTTNFSGKRFRGHLYFPFPTVGNVQTDGVPTAAYQTSLSNFANSLIAFTTVQNGPHTGTATVAMYLHHRAGISPTPLATPITGKVVPGKFATQRRRGSYGRPNSSPI